jgi:predicted nucleic acid-binding protein
MPVRKFLDTSAEVKLYVPEPDTPVVQAEVDAADELLLSRLTELEFRSALYGMVRMGRISSSAANIAVTAFLSDLLNYTVVPIDEAVFQRAQILLDNHAVGDNLRPLDALQIASLLEENGRHHVDVFVTTDKVQIQVAVAHGLAVAP